MKEYRLKKWYPSLPKGWKNEETIIVVERDGKYMLHPSLKHVDNSYEGGTLIKLTNREEIENNPEYWEEIKPVRKDYEIIRLRAGGDIFAKFFPYGERQSRWLRKGAPSSEKYHTDLKVGGYYAAHSFEIQMVKRLHDGKTFSIGDPVEFGKKGMISKIREVDNQIYVDVEYFEGKGNGYSNASLNSIKVLLKNYEILSITSDEGVVSSKTIEGKVIWEGDARPEWHSIAELLSGGEHFIHSIKRLSDGEVFTLGEKVTYSNNKRYDFIVEKIEITEKNEVTLHDGRYDQFCKLHISNLKVAPKEPLLTTEDGVEIFEKEKVFVVEDDFRITPLVVYGNTNFFKGKRVFSSKEKAEEFVLYNKPMFSIKEIRDILRGKFIIPVNSLFISKAKEKTGI